MARLVWRPLLRGGALRLRVVIRERPQSRAEQVRLAELVNLAAGRAGSAGWLAAQAGLAELVRLAASEAGSAGWLAAQVGLAPQLP